MWSVVIKGSSVLPLRFDLKELADDPAYSFSFRLLKQEVTTWPKPKHELAMAEFIFSPEGDNPLYLKKVYPKMNRFIVGFLNIGYALSFLKPFARRVLGAQWNITEFLRRRNGPYISWNEIFSHKCQL